MSGVDTPWLTIVGCLPSGALAPNAPHGVLEAPVVFGAARMLEAAGVAADRRRPWPSPLSEGLRALHERRGAPTTVLASGDPLNHGLATTLLKSLSPCEIEVFPAPSAFSLAAAALRWPLDQLSCISLHNAPPEDILLHAHPGRRVLALTRDGAAPTAIAAVLSSAGFGASQVAVLERLGSEDATVHHATAAELEGTFDPLNTLAVDCAAQPAIGVDDLEHDGCVTRDEIRLLTIAALGPPGHLWDVGAGSGAVAIDWCRAGGTASLFERNAKRCDALRRNVAATGVGRQVSVFEGDANDRLAEAEPCDAVFLGGAVSDETLFEASAGQLRSGGRYVANSVTLEGDAASIRRHAERGGRLTRIDLAHAAPIGGLTAMRPAMSVLQWHWIKP